MPFSKQTQRGKYRRVQASDFPANYTEHQIQRIQGKLVAEDDKTERRGLIVKSVKLLYGFEAHSGQVDCISWMLQQNRDLIFVAKTSFGKSLIMQVLPCLVPHSIILAVLPLSALGLEQEGKVQSLGRLARPIFVHDGNAMSKNLLRDIRQGVYTRVLSSPGTFTGRRLSDILRDPTFRASVKWVVVDELHLVYIWGSAFRTSYSLLQKMRNAIGWEIWFGCTATFDNETFQNVCRELGFKETTIIKRFSINRPEIAIVRATRGSAPARWQMLFDYGCNEVQVLKTFTYTDSVHPSTSTRQT